MRTRPRASARNAQSTKHRHLLAANFQWPVRRPQPSLLVPPTSIVTTTERTFVVRVNNGVAQRVNITRGARVGDLVEVFGALMEGDMVARRGTDEIRDGSKINTQRNPGL